MSRFNSSPASRTAGALAFAMAFAGAPDLARCRRQCPRRSGGPDQVSCRRGAGHSALFQRSGEGVENKIAELLANK